MSANKLKRSNSSNINYHHCCPILCQCNALHILSTCFYKIHVNIIFPSYSRHLQKVTVSWDVPNVLPWPLIQQRMYHQIYLSYFQNILWLFKYLPKQLGNEMGRVSMYNLFPCFPTEISCEGNHTTIMLCFVMTVNLSVFAPDSHPHCNSQLLYGELLHNDQFLYVTKIRVLVQMYQCLLIECCNILS
jgi:hypothetical protein